MPTKQASAEESPQATTSKKLRARAIKWVQQDIKLIVDWFCERDEQGIAYNYAAYSTRTHTDIAERMLQETNRCTKPLANKKKAADKLDVMIKQYEDMRLKARRSCWGVEAEAHKQHEMISKYGSTVEEYILKKCPWYYKFERVFHSHPGVNPPIVIEYGQPPRRNGQDVEEQGLGGFDDNDNDAKCDDETDEDSLHSVNPLNARSAEAIRATVEKTLLPPMIDDEDDSILDMPPAKESRTFPVRSKTAPIELTEQSSPEPTPKAVETTSKATPKEKTKATRGKNKRPLPEDSDGEEETSENGRSQWRKMKGRTSIAEAMLERAKINDCRLREQADMDREERQLERQQRQQRYELERQQLQNHHEAEMAGQQVLINQSQERLIRIQLELVKEENRQSQKRGRYGVGCLEPSILRS